MSLRNLWYCLNWWKLVILYNPYSFNISPENDVYCKEKYNDNGVDIKPKYGS